MKWLNAEFLGAALFLLFGAFLFLHPFPAALADYANWTYQGVLLSHHWKHLPETAHLVKLYPVPNSAATFGVACFALFFPWAIAGKLWLCVQFALCFYALHHFARTLRLSGWMWALVPVAAFFSVDLWYGFVNFVLGVAWAVLFASMLLRRAQGEHPARSFDAPLALVLVLAFFTHMIPFAFCCWMLFWYAAQLRRRGLLWSMAPTVLLTLWYIFARYFVFHNVDGETGQVAAQRYLSVSFWLFKANSYLKSFGFVNPILGYFPVHTGARLLVFFLCNVLLALLSGWLIVRTARDHLRERTPQRFLWLAILSTLPVVLLLPSAALGIGDPGARLLQVLLGIALILIFQSPSRLFPLIGTLALLMTANSAILFARLVTSPQRTTPPHITALPRAITYFATTPYANQIYFYQALSQADTGIEIFSSGVLINLPSARHAVLPPIP
ncbi:MAG: hypothetical protein PW735_05715 [Acidobacteriaceae bacterium]|nr:hypothetical protein [Acidobacteriaceae bacterium]